jgi:predicted RNA-binding Zn-ribbon protein involved in translation (DUF1610 family)
MQSYVCRSTVCSKSRQNAFGRFLSPGEAEACPRCGSEDIQKAAKVKFNFGNSYTCLECGERSDFEQPEDVPYCLFCNSEDVCWLPQKFASPGEIDKTLRMVADRYGLSDMGQRGGTRAGESARKTRVQPSVERYQNVEGINVPVTDSVTSTWAKAEIPTRINNINATAPYAGLPASKPIPFTEIQAATKGG